MTQDADIQLIAETAGRDEQWCWVYAPPLGRTQKVPRITDYIELIEWASGQDLMGHPSSGEFAVIEWSWLDCLISTIGRLFDGTFTADECKARLIKIIAAAIRENHD